MECHVPNFWLLCMYVGGLLCLELKYRCHTQCGDQLSEAKPQRRFPQVLEGLAK
jgi:hypothetical protein